MNLRILHSRFELNLIDTSFTMIEENNWFKNQYVSKYTYPITKELTDEENVALDFIANHYAKGDTLIYDVDFYVLNRRHAAVMEIERCTGRLVEFQIRYGLEEFPNWTKKLAQLPLHKFELVGETMYEHSEDMIDVSYPDEDYCFAQVFTEKFDTSSEQWEAFEGAVNNYVGGAMLINEYDELGDLQINRNVIQPIPFLLYLLKAGLLDKGYTLAGDILTDPHFSIAAVYSLSEFYSQISEGAKQELLILADEYYEIQEFPYVTGMGLYSGQILLPEPGRYKITGNLFLRSTFHPVYGTYSAFAWLKLNGQYIGNWSSNQPEGFFLMDIVVEVLPGQTDVPLDFFANTDLEWEIGGILVTDSTIVDLTVTQLVKYDANGDPIPTLVAANEIDLTKCVPDVTFGELITAIDTWKNYDIDISGNVVTMNKVMDLVGGGAEFDLSPFEVKFPERNFSQGKSFELKFQDVSSDNYEFQSVLVTIEGATQSPYVKRDDTEEIVINAIPLPVKTKGTVTTADGFIDDKAKIQIILFDGLVSGVNRTLDASDLLIPAIYESEFQEWLDFLINTIEYRWEFNSSLEGIRDLTLKSTPFAYGKRFVVKKITRSKRGRDIIQAEVEVLTIK